MNRYWTRVVWALGIAGFVLLTFILVDWLGVDKSLIKEGHPDFSLVGWGRTVVLALCCWGLAVVVMGKNRPELALCESRSKLTVYLTGYFTCFLSIGFTLLLLLKHQQFNALSHEDSYVEWASFALLIVSSLIFLISMFSCRRSAGQRFPWAAATCAVFAFGFFFIGMEEVSWFQRQLGFKTPDVLFEGNVQEEFNFHNFFTVGFEILYYFGTFAFFMALPFLRVIFAKWIEKTPYFDTFVPQPCVAVLGAMSCGYNYEMWNIFPVQICLIGAVVVLLFFLRFCQQLSERLLIGFTAVVLVASQWVFLISKTRYERIWEVTEYKELFITIGFVVYAASTLRKIQTQRRAC